MKGWTGLALRVDLTRRKYLATKIDPHYLREFLGGRGLAIRFLWEELPMNTDPLSPKNMLIFSAGPLTGLPLPSSGKLVVASKSPLTNGYGDGNLGSNAAVALRKAGYDVLIITGKAEKPVYLLIDNGKVEFKSADDLWGLSTFEVEERLKMENGNSVGILTIGPAGENLVKFSTITSQRGRSGGRPGMGAVMGSKNLKAIVIRGTKPIQVYDSNELRRLAEKCYSKIQRSDNYSFWIRQGTMSTIEWANKNSVLPTYNFKEGIFEREEEINGYAMERIKVDRRGCPYCTMECGNVVRDLEERESELDYENVAMLGSNIGIGDLKEVSTLNRYADEYGLDTISLGNVIGFAIEASSRGLLNEKIEWGDYKAILQLVKDIAKREGIGDLLAEGVKRASERIGGKDFAMHVKGLEVSAYDCHTAIGMALAYGTSPIGAHHKDAWIIGWELSKDRFGVSREKVEKIVELQRIRGGFFESLTVCRFPWIELNIELEWYLRFLRASTGISFDMSGVYRISDRIYTLIRAFWIREFGRWRREMDYPPIRWFKEPLNKGPFKGAKLDLNSYDILLDYYYELRGWNRNGIPKEETLEKLNLSYAKAILDRSR